jgi:hypothetical protein
VENRYYFSYKGKGSRDELENYRGILLLPLSGKILCGVLAGRLRDWVVNRQTPSIFR